MFSRECRLLKVFCLICKLIFLHLLKMRVITSLLLELQLNRTYEWHHSPKEQRTVEGKGLSSTSAVLTSSSPLLSPSRLSVLHSFLSFFPFLMLGLSTYPLAATLAMLTEDEKQNSLVLRSAQNNPKTEEAN